MNTTISMVGLVGIQPLIQPAWLRLDLGSLPVGETQPISHVQPPQLSAGSKSNLTRAKQRGVP